MDDPSLVAATTAPTDTSSKRPLGVDPLAEALDALAVAE